MSLPRMMHADVQFQIYRLEQMAMGGALAFNAEEIRNACHLIRTLATELDATAAPVVVGEDGATWEESRGFGRWQSERMAKRLDDARTVEEETAGLEATIDAMRTAADLLRRRERELGAVEDGYLGQALRRLHDGVRDSRGSTVTITKADACAIGYALTAALAGD